MADEYLAVIDRAIAAAGKIVDLDGRATAMSDMCRIMCFHHFQQYINLARVQKEQGNARRRKPSSIDWVARMEAIKQMIDNLSRDMQGAVWKAKPLANRHDGIDDLRRALQPTKIEAEKLAARAGDIIDLGEVFESVEAPEALEQWVADTAHTWRWQGLLASGGSTNSAGVKDSPFQRFMQHLVQELPDDVRPQMQRKQLSNAIDYRLRQKSNAVAP